MFNSKPLPPFTFDVLCYLNRDQLERFSIVCRPLKNIIDRYFHTKPYRVFDELRIRGGLYALVQNYEVQWHPNRDGYSVQQFLTREKCSNDQSKLSWSDPTYYSFSEMRPYLCPSVRINCTVIYVAQDATYNPELIAEMESISYLWRDGDIGIWSAICERLIYGTVDFRLILSSPIILQCRKLTISNARFSFKDYKILYAVKTIEICSFGEHENDLWQQFLEHPEVKPVVAFLYLHRKDVNDLIDRLSKTFSSATSPNAFKVAFILYYKQTIAEFRETNITSGEILELKKGLPVEYQNDRLNEHNKCYTLERSSI